MSPTYTKTNHFTLPSCNMISILGCLIKCFILPASRSSQFKLTSLLKTWNLRKSSKARSAQNPHVNSKDDSRWSFLHVKLIAAHILEIPHLPLSHHQLSLIPYLWQIIFSTTSKIPNRIYGSQKLIENLHMRSISFGL